MGGGRIAGVGDREGGGVFRSEAADHRLMSVVAAGVKRNAPCLCAHWIGSPHHTAGCSFFCRVILHCARFALLNNNLPAVLSSSPML